MIFFKYLTFVFNSRKLCEQGRVFFEKVIRRSGVIFSCVVPTWVHSACWFGRSSVTGAGTGLYRRGRGRSGRGDSQQVEHVFSLFIFPLRYAGVWGYLWCPLGEFRGGGERAGAGGAERGELLIAFIK